LVQLVAGALMALFSPRFWGGLTLVAALAFTHGFVYKAGREAVRAKWDAEKVVQLAAAAKAEADNRRIESERQKKVIEAQNEAAQRAKTLQAAADRARAQSDSLRNDLATIRLQLPGLAREAVNRYADTASVVFGDCSRAYQELAGQADRIASERQTLIDAWPTK